MGFRNPATSATALDTRSSSTTAGVRAYNKTQPWGVQGVIEFDDGISGDTAATIVAGPAYQQQGGGYAPAGGSMKMQAGTWSGVAGPDFELNVETAPAGGYQATARLKGATDLDLGGAQLTGAGAPPVAQTFLPANGFVIESGTTLGVYLDGAGIAHLDGIVQNAAAFTPNGTQVILTVPAAYRPKRDRYFHAELYSITTVISCHLSASSGQLITDNATAQIPASSFWDLSALFWNPATL